MDFNATIDLIIKDLNEASEIIDDLKKYPGVPALQVELAKSKCRSAGEVIALLKSMSITTDNTLIQDKNLSQVKEEKTVAEQMAKVSKPPEEKKKISDRVEKPTPTVEKKAEKDLSEQLKAKPIKSLSEAIGISDKFLFMGEIFNGDKDAYSQAISRLDKAESLQDAMAIIMSYTGENSENEAVSQLLDLVKLKLPSHE